MSTSTVVVLPRTPLQVERAVRADRPRWLRRRDREYAALLSCYSARHQGDLQPAPSRQVALETARQARGLGLQAQMMVRSPGGTWLSYDGRTITEVMHQRGWTA